VTLRHWFSFYAKTCHLFLGEGGGGKISSDVTCGPISHGGDPFSIPGQEDFMVYTVTGFCPNTVAALSGSPFRRNGTVCLFCATLHFRGVATTNKGRAEATLRPGQRLAIVTKYVAQFSKRIFFITKKMYVLMCAFACYALSLL
jgi:hypothetical protein